MFEFLFGYPYITFQESQWALGSHWPLTFLYGGLILSAVLIGVLLLRAKSALSFFQTLSLGVLQWSMIGLVLLLLWQPSLISERLKPNENAIALMLDVSESMAYGDAQNQRIEVARDILASDAIDELRETYQIDHYLFSDHAVPADNFDNIPNPGEQTRMGRSLLEALERAKAKSLAALVLVSDGAESGSPLSEEQLAEIAAYGVPVHTVGVGREQIEEDLELERLIVPDKVLPNTLVTAEAVIRHDAPGEVRLKVYNGEEFLASRDVELSGSAGSTSARIEFDLGEAGFKELSFQLDPIEDEKNLENNRRSHVVEVASQQYSVLYLEGEPRWEYKYIRRALTDDPTVDLMTLLWVSDNKFYRQGVSDPSQLETGFPEDREALFAFDAIMIGSIEAPRLSADQQQLIHEFVSERGGSLLLLGGRKGLSAGNWGNTPVGDILPVRLKDITNSYVKERARALLSPEGLSTAFLTLDETEESNLERWDSLPALDNYQELGTLRPAASTLLHVKADENADPEPLLVRQPYGKGQSFVLATGGTWRWQMNMPSEDNSHQTFWQQLTRALVANSPETMNFSVEAQGDEFKLVAEVRDENYQPLSDVRVLAVMSAENDTDSGLASGIELEASPDIAGRYEARVSAEAAGTYYIDAIASRNDEPLDAARVAVHQPDTASEAFGLRQDRAQLEQIAAVTDGAYWTPEQVTGIPQAIEGSTAGVVEQVRYSLWGAPILFLMLMLLKVGEWLLRRRWGHI